MKLIPHSLTAGGLGRGIRGLIGVGRLFAPVPSQSPTSTVAAANAAPKGISGRTSYRQVRLAFHLYPQVIQSICN